MAGISNNNIARAIYLASKTDSGESFYKKVVHFLAKKRLISKSGDILARLNKIINEEEGRAVAKVSSSRKLDSDLKKELEQKIARRYAMKTANIIENLDERLLGGFKIEVNDEVIDLTLKNKISQLQEYLIKS